jgi:hypothetical protein
MDSIEPPQMVIVQRHWDDGRRCPVPLASLRNLYWGDGSDGHRLPSNQLFICGYVWCTEVDKRFPHSCRHGPPPHSIKVVVIKEYQNQQVFNELLSIVGPKPEPHPRRVWVPFNPVPLASLNLLAWRRRDMTKRTKRSAGWTQVFRMHSEQLIKAWVNKDEVMVVQEWYGQLDDDFDFSRLDQWAEEMRSANQKDQKNIMRKMAKEVKERTRSLIVVRAPEGEPIGFSHYHDADDPEGCLREVRLRQEMINHMGEIDHCFQLGYDLMEVAEYVTIPLANTGDALGLLKEEIEYDPIYRRLDELTEEEYFRDRVFHRSWAKLFMQEMEQEALARGDDLKEELMQDGDKWLAEWLEERKREREVVEEEE